MRLSKAFVPYGIWWSTPFVKWQGALAGSHPLRLAAACAKQTLDARGVDPTALTSLVLGFTIPSKHSFYGAPWVATMLGAPGVTGPTMMQACATGARCVATAAAAVENGGDDAVLVITADKCSNGPHLYYPDPNGPGGKGDPEDWVWDNFSLDPVAKNAMVQTAENCAKEAGVSREAQDAITVVRYAQYHKAVADGFHKRFMILPFEVKDPSGRKVLATVQGDDGIFPTSSEGLAKLRPVMEGGTVTFGTQTHPADGNAGILVTSADRAKALSKSPGITVRIASFAQANAKKGFMAQAVAPAARKALDAAGFSIKDVAVKTHNPFAVNDLLFAKEMGIDAEGFNEGGSPLVYGHPQGPTGTRAIIELVEMLAMRGGGRGLFVGCAAGDTAAAVCVQVDCR
jgi:acetyl-CoA acetyltransferase